MSHNQSNKVQNGLDMSHVSITVVIAIGALYEGDGRGITEI